MTELELRQKVCNNIIAWIGCKKGDATHRSIIDLYNTQKKLPRNYRLKYSDHWCAGTVTATWIKTGILQYIFGECSCACMINLAKEHGIWVENDAHIPTIGDCVLYDWQDSTKTYATTDNTGAPDHIGIVTSVDLAKKRFVVTEGNMTTKSICGQRSMMINGCYIRGFICPNYAAIAKKLSPSETPTTVSNPEYFYIVKGGDTLSKIAAKFGVTTTDLAKWNGIKNPNVISVGQKIYTNEAAAAIGKIAKLGIINSEDYWQNIVAEKKVPNLNYLFIKATNILTKVQTRAATPEEGITLLQKKGIISSPDWWKANYSKYKSVGDLLMALGGAAR